MGCDSYFCSGCLEQPHNDFPHDSLTVISHIPEESTIYLCGACGTYWACNVTTGWDELLQTDMSSKS